MQHFNDFLEYLDREKKKETEILFSFPLRDFIVC